MEEVISKKACTILCIAGLNPVDYTLSRFNEAVPIWLVRAYIALFKVVPPGLIVAPMSARDNETNCKVIINELCMQNYLNVNHNSNKTLIMQLVDALHRKYMTESSSHVGKEQIPQIEQLDDLINAPPKHIKENHRNLSKAEAKRNIVAVGNSPPRSGSKHGSPHRGDVEYISSDSNDNMEVGKPKKKSTLSDRIRYLERKLGADGENLVGGKQKRRRKRKKPTGITVSDYIRSEKCGDVDASDGVTKQNNSEHEIGALPASDGEAVAEAPGAATHTSPKRPASRMKKRPTSAPSVRRIVSPITRFGSPIRPRSNSVSPNTSPHRGSPRTKGGPGDRTGMWSYRQPKPEQPKFLLSTEPLFPKESETTRNSFIKKTIEKHLGHKATCRDVIDRDDGDDAMVEYVYDVMTGRKKVKTGNEDEDYAKGKVKEKPFEQLREEERKRRLAELPPTPVWPGIRTQSSTLEWVRKMRVTRESEEQKMKNKKTLLTLPLYKPLFQQAYMFMEPGDIIVSVEHCVNCEHHNTTLRHNAHDYTQRADDALKVCARMLYDANIAARVGVFRFHANVTKHSQVTDESTRIGACDVQIAYKSPEQELIVEVLHSKLCSRSWPSKTAFSKRLDSFLAKLPPDTKRPGLVVEVAEDEETPEIEYNQGPVASGLAAYPVGPHIPWLKTVIGACSRGVQNPRNNWAYMPNNSISLSAIGYCNVQEKMSEEIHEGLPYVQWVYDSRCLLKYPPVIPSVPDPPQPAEAILEDVPVVTPPGFENGKTIFVPQNGRHMAAAIVQSLSRIGGSIHVTCQMKYEDKQLVVPLADCDTKPCKHELWTENVSNADAEIQSVKYPLELYTLLYYARIVDGRVGLWGKDDSVVSIPFYEFFQQLRTIVEAVELKNCNNGSVNAANATTSLNHSVSGEVSEKASVYSPRADKWVDLQLAYSDTSMNWLLGGEEYSNFPLIKNTGEAQDLKYCLVDVRALENIAIRSVMPQISGGETIVPPIDSVGRSATMSEVKQAIAEDVIKSVAKSLNNTELTAADAGNGDMEADTTAAVVEGAQEPLNESAIQRSTHRTASTLRNTIIEVAKKIHSYRSPKSMARSKGDHGDGRGEVLNVDGLIEVFQVLDTQHNGELDIKEFVKALEMMGINCNEQVLEAISASFDTDGDGRISLEEFVEFVSHAPEQGRELGELWSIIRSGILSAEDEMAEVEDTGLPSVQDIQDRFELMIQERMLRNDDGENTEGVLAGPYVSGSEFMSVIDGLKFRCELEDTDKMLLVKSFAELISDDASDKLTKKQSNPDPDSHSTSANTTAANVAIDFNLYKFRYVDFLCWIQPVDVHKVVKRIARIIKAALRSEKGMEDVDGQIVSDLRNIMSIAEKKAKGESWEHIECSLMDTRKNISLVKFHDCIENLGLPVTNAEIRALTRHVAGGELASLEYFSVEEFYAVLTGKLPIRREKSIVQKEHVSAALVTSEADDASVAASGLFPSTFSGVGVLSFNKLVCTKLRKIDRSSKQDPYVKLSIRESDAAENKSYTMHPPPCIWSHSTDVKDQGGTECIWENMNILVSDLSPGLILKNNMLDVYVYDSNVETEHNVLLGFGSVDYHHAIKAINCESELLINLKANVGTEESPSLIDAGVVTIYLSYKESHGDDLNQSVDGSIASTATTRSHSASSLISSPSSPKIKNVSNDALLDLTPDPESPADSSLTDLDIVIRQIDIESSLFKMPEFDKMVIDFSIQEKGSEVADVMLHTNTSGYHEKSLPIRSFDVEDRWEKITISASQFKSCTAIIRLRAVSDKIVSRSFDCPIVVPLYIFMEKPGKIHSVKKVVPLPLDYHDQNLRRRSFRASYQNLLVGAKADIPKVPKNYVQCTINFFVRETLASRQKRIECMTSVPATSLLEMKFAPLPLEDDDLGESDDDFIHGSTSSGGALDSSVGSATSLDHLIGGGGTPKSKPPSSPKRRLKSSSRKKLSKDSSEVSLGSLIPASGGIGNSVEGFGIAARDSPSDSELLSPSLSHDLMGSMVDLKINE